MGNKWYIVAQSSLVSVNAEAERSKLVDLYQNGGENMFLSDAVGRQLKNLQEICIVPIRKDIVQVIHSRCRLYGNDVPLKYTGFNYEVERELALKREKEKEQENEERFPALSPIAEKPWTYNNIASCTSIEDVRNLTAVRPADKEFGSIVFLPGFGMIQWRIGKLFGTGAFFETVETKADARMKFFVRIADGFLRFPNDEILLLSDREMEGILEVALRAPKTLGSLQIVNYVPVRYRLHFVQHSAETEQGLLHQFKISHF